MSAHPTVTTDSALYRQCIDFVQQNILELSHSPDSIMRVDVASDFKFVADANSAHGIFADPTGKTVKSIRGIGELGRNQMTDPYFSLTNMGKPGVRILLSLSSLRTVTYRNVTSPLHRRELRLKRLNSTFLFPDL